MLAGNSSWFDSNMAAGQTSLKEGFLQAEFKISIKSTVVRRVLFQIVDRLFPY